MFINWLGQSCFKIQDKEKIIITDPFGLDCGLKPPRLKADIVTVSHQHNNHNNIKSIMGEPLVITEPGEYEFKDIYIYGLASWHDNQQGAQRGNNIIYRFEIDDLSVTHLGDLGHLLTDEQIASLEGTDVLFVPVGGTYTLDSQQAVKVVSQIEPRIVIPMHYAIPKLKIKLDSIDKFCKEIGICTQERPTKVKITTKDLPQEHTKVIVMQQG